jgi:hypothetical protein
VRIGPEYCARFQGAHRIADIDKDLHGPGSERVFHEAKAFCRHLWPKSVKSASDCFVSNSKAEVSAACLKQKSVLIEAVELMDDPKSVVSSFIGLGRNNEIDILWPEPGYFALKRFSVMTGAVENGEVDRFWSNGLGTQLKELPSKMIKGASKVKECIADSDVERGRQIHVISDAIDYLSGFDIRLDQYFKWEELKNDFISLSNVAMWKLARCSFEMALLSLTEASILNSSSASARFLRCQCFDAFNVAKGFPARHAAMNRHDGMIALRVT